MSGFAIHFDQWLRETWNLPNGNPAHAWINAPAFSRAQGVVAVLRIGPDGLCHVDVWHGSRKDCSFMPVRREELQAKTIPVVLAEAAEFLGLPAEIAAGGQADQPSDVTR